MKESSTKLKEYLLGSLSEIEAEEISLRIITDAGLENELIFAENDLIEDYLEKQLSPIDEKLFFENFLTGEPRTNLLNEIALIKNYSTKYQNATDNSTGAATTQETLFRKWLEFLRHNIRPAVGFATLLLIFLAVGLVLQGDFGRANLPQTPLEAEFAELNQKGLDGSNIPSKIILTAVTLRGSSSVKKIIIKDLPDRVYFQLVVPFEIINREWLKVELLRYQKIQFTQARIPIIKNQHGQEIRLLLPKIKLLDKGSYQIKLEVPNSSDSSIIYSFVVE